MDIVHVDPGYGKVLQSYSGTGTTFVENDEYNPYSGVAFTHEGNGGSVYARLPNIDFTFEPNSQFYKKVWSLKFSVYTPGSGVFHAGFSTVASGAAIHGQIRIVGNGYDITRFVENTQLSEYHSGFSAGFHNVSITYSLTADGTGSGTSYIRTTTIEVDEVVDFQTYALATIPSYLPEYALFNFGGGSNHYYVSNVLVGQASYEGDGTGSIPSDDGIPANTPVYRLPLGTPDTDFELGDDGIYIAKENGQTLLQTVNASSLVTTHGNQPINHIVAYGNPGYRVGTAVTAATGISKEGNDITPHGTHTLSFEKDMHVYDVWKIAEGSTFNDINGLQVGWRAGE